MMRSLTVALVAAAVSLSAQRDPSAQAVVMVRALSAAQSLSALREADRTVTALSRSGRLSTVANFDDVMVPGRQHERFQQVINGVPVWATTVTRQHERGVPVSVFGEVYEGLENFDTVSVLSAAEARDVAAADAGVTLGAVPTKLHVLMTAAGPRLVYTVRAARPGFKLTRYFIDAKSGAIVDTRDDQKRQQVGTGTGVFGPPKKISTRRIGALFVTADDLRPPVLDTFNFRGNPFAFVDYVNGLRSLGQSDYASDIDNTWTDGAAVDAHVHAGWTYDYLLKRFGRHGLDDRDLPILNIVHPVNRADMPRYGDVFWDLFTNAFYAGDGLMVYGEGLPVGMTIDGVSIDYLAGALDVVAHELTHGLTEYTSQLEYEGESGALDEAFADMLGTSVEWFFQTAGPGRGQADYQIGEDVFSAGGIRSMSDPSAFGHPDHYSRRYTGQDDNGGVHINSTIPSHAFYLAIEGGRNATSGVTVTGVGSANRQQIEQVFYRAFSSMLPARATFSTARAATIQAARDLYGATSRAELAVIQAWTAVGVF